MSVLRAILINHHSPPIICLHYLLAFTVKAIVMPTPSHSPIPQLDPVGFFSAEPVEARGRRVAAVYEILKLLHPAKFELNHRNAFEMLIATMLAARSLDSKVNELTPALFAGYPDAERMATATAAEIEPLIKGVMSYKQKANYLVNTAQAIVKYHGGHVPADLDALVKFPGVGRKTAIMVLGTCFDQHVGIPVDTHVNRVSTRLAFSVTDDPDGTEADLKPLVPQAEWTAFAQRLVLHGRYTCVAKAPKCAECPIRALCPSRSVD